ncbi:MAG: MoxR family ATPase [Oscillospiraceae bacterium]|nr:MoxR family ATPase [Oscillospiraceae bacterium]
MNCSQTISAIKSNISSVIVGKDETIELLLICLACGGHALIEDVPGMGKTTIVSALASSVDCSFHRIQFTPDVLPSDITGFTVINPVTGEERFAPGAIMCNVLLADELNRTSPKTQSALLQAMQEGVATVDGVTCELPKPFIVCATQNPVEQAGTYPLPEAQLDRFLMRISMGYPNKREEAAILERSQKGGITVKIPPVATAQDVLAMQKMLNAVVCAAPVVNYIVDIAQKTRENADIALGISPRGAIALMRASMGRAMMKGRDYVLPDDVREMAGHTLCHRLSQNARVHARDTSEIVNDIVRSVKIPVVNGA